MAIIIDRLRLEKAHNKMPISVDGVVIKTDPIRIAFFWRKWPLQKALTRWLLYAIQKIPSGCLLSLNSCTPRGNLIKVAK